MKHAAYYKLPAAVKDTTHDIAPAPYPDNSTKSWVDQRSHGKQQRYGHPILHIERPDECCGVTFWTAIRWTDRRGRRNSQRYSQHLFHLDKSDECCGATLRTAKRWANQRDSGSSRQYEQYLFHVDGP